MNCAFNGAAKKYIDNMILKCQARRLSEAVMNDIKNHRKKILIAKVRSHNES